MLGFSVIAVRHTSRSVVVRLTEKFNLHVQKTKISRDLNICD